LTGGKNPQHAISNKALIWIKEALKYQKMADKKLKK
jgi:hypothetical protein